MFLFLRVALDETGNGEHFWLTAVVDAHIVSMEQTEENFSRFLLVVGFFDVVLVVSNLGLGLGTRFEIFRDFNCSDKDFHVNFLGLFGFNFEQDKSCAAHGGLNHWDPRTMSVDVESVENLGKAHVPHDERATIFTSFCLVDMELALGRVHILCWSSAKHEHSL